MSKALSREANAGSERRSGGFKPVTVAIAGGALLLVAPLVLYPVFVMKVLCFALFAAAFNLLLGYVGLLSFGHAAFFGGAAYITAHATKFWNVTPEIGILLGASFAALMGLCVGFLAIRRQGIYFAMITLALAQMVYFVCVQMPFTHGEDGIQGVPRGWAFNFIDLEHPLKIYYFVAAIFTVCFYAIWRVIHSPFWRNSQGHP